MQKRCPYVSIYNVIETPRDFLKSLSLNALNDIVDQDIEAADEGRPDATPLVGLVVNEYPGLAGFISDTLGRHFDVDCLDEDTAAFIEITSFVVLGAVCRAAELKSMPQFDD